MLQIKIWAFNPYLPKGVTGKKMESVINKFMRENKIVDSSFEVFQLENGNLFFKVLYEVRKKK